MENLDSRLSVDPYYSARRYQVDRFLNLTFQNRSADDSIIDVGGRRARQRGFYERIYLKDNITYVNIDPSTDPDIVCDATSIPVDDNSYSAALCCEVLEHVFDPKAVLKEMRRIVKPGGFIYVVVPFMYPVHADPDDYGRYTDSFWRRSGSELNLIVESLDPQGDIYTLTIDMIKTVVKRIFESTSRRDRYLARFVRKIMPFVMRILLQRSKSNQVDEYKKYSNGYAVIFKKPNGDVN